MRRFLLVLALSCCMVPVAARGAMSGEHDLRVIRTEWFDIIFPARSEPQAQRLAARADGIYREIAQAYGMEPQFRMPVVITPAVEQHNAYFSQAFYNHIVLYDAPPVPDMDVFSDSLVSTFTHELTHAYTYNMKDGFWKGVGMVFGDTVNPGHLLLTRGWAEGATLTMESSRGEGRMNSGYSLQMVRQAAIEGKFPAYADVQGARDTYPAGSFYNFNGGFNQWLQDTYGMERYARFWYSCINLEALTAGGAFKQAYGVSLGWAWKEFQRQVQLEVAGIPANPLTEMEAEGAGLPQASDFFEPDSGEFSSRNRAGSLYSSLVASHRWLAWIDSATSTIYRSPIEKKAAPQVQRVATFQGIQSIRLSQDGRFLVATVLSQKSATAKVQLWLLDFDSNQWQRLSSGGRENGMIVRSNSEDGYLLLSTEYRNGATSLHIQRLVEDGKKFRLESICQGDFQESTQYRDFVDLGGGRIAFIKSHRGKQHIVLAQLDAAGRKESPPLQVLEELSLEDCIQTAGPEASSGPQTGSEAGTGSGTGLSIRSLSASTGGDRLLFSWATKDTLPRLGVLELPHGFLSSGHVKLQTADISGGVHFPVCLAAGEGGVDGGELAFVGAFYLENRLLTSSLSHLSMESQVLVQEQNGLEQSQQEQESAPQLASSRQETTPLATEGSRLEAASLPSSSYNPLGYYGRGIFLPLALNLAIPHYGSNRDTMALPVGVTWMSSNPWLQGIATASLGYGVDSKSVAYNLSYQNGTDTSLFQYSLSHGSEFDVTGTGWLHSTVTAEGTTNLPLGRISRLSLGNITRLQLGQEIQEEAPRTLQQHPAAASGNPYLHLISAATASWAHIQQWGPGLHERLGISLGTEIYYTMNTALPARQLNMSAGNIGLSASFFIPKLLPLRTVQNHTYNLPTIISATLFPSGLASDGETPLLSYSWGQAPSMAAAVQAKTILYSINIQKALPVVTAVYVNSFDISLRGTVGFEDRLYLDGTDTTAGSLVIPRGDGSWRILRLDEYLSRLGGEQVPVVANLALRASLGITPNVGFSAYPLLGGSLYFELTTEGLTRPFAPVFRLGLTSRW